MSEWASDDPGLTGRLKDRELPPPLLAECPPPLSSPLPHNAGPGHRQGEKGR